MKISWLKAAPLLALNAVFWIAYAVMVGVLWVIGVPLIRREAKALNFEYQPSRVWPPESRRVVRWRRAWMNPVWGNEQDGIDGLPYDDEHTFVGSLTWWPNKSFRSVAERIIEWSALRNSTNNLRFMHYFVPWLGWLNPNTIEPKRIRWRGTEAPLDAVLLKRRMSSWADEYGGKGLVYEAEYCRRFACLFVSQGLYAGLRIAVRFRGRAHQAWFGWKLNPGMAVEGWWPEDPCWKGVGFTCGQVRHSA